MREHNSVSFIKFIDNIWYHYKYVILAVIAALIMFCVATCQYVTKKEPDIFVYHISVEGLTASSKDNFRKSMALIADDYNGDGVVTVDFKEEVYTPSLQAVQGLGEMSVTESFNLELALGDCIIYIMDKTFYEGNKQYMADIEEAIGYLPEYAYDEKAMLLSELPAYKRVPGLQDFLPESYICLRERRSGMDEDEYAAHVDYFKKLVEFVEYDN